MDGVLNTSVLSTAGRLSGRDCSRIPFKLPSELVFMRKMLWEDLLMKYEMLEQDSMNHKSVCVPELGISTRNNTSSCCVGKVMQSIHTELPDAGGSWEDRKKYRKSMDLVQHWVNTSGHGIHVHFDQVFPVPTEQVEMSLSVSGRELGSRDDLSDVTSCFQTYLNNCELCSTRRLQELSNVDGTPGYCPDHTHDELGHMVLMTQERQPTKQARSITKSLKSCSKIPDSESGMLFTDKKSSRTVSDSVSCNKTPVSRKNILESASKDTSSPKEISLRTCDQIGTPTDGECATGKKISVPGIETSVRNYNDSPAVRKEDHSVEDRKCTSKFILENCGKGSPAINTAPRALDPTLTPHAGAESTNKLVSGKRTFFSNGSEVLETSNGSICKKGNLRLIKGVSSCGKGTLAHNDKTRPIKQKLWFDLLDTEDGIKNSGPKHSLLKEKPESGYRSEKDIDSCGTDVTFGRVIFVSKTVAPTSGMESGMGRCGRRQKFSLFSDADCKVSQTRKNAHRYSKSPTAAKAGVVSHDCYTTVSGTETSVGNFFTVSMIKKVCALMSRREVDLRDYSGDPTVRKKRILTMNEKDSLPATEEMMKDVECSSLSLKDKVSGEGGESLESLKGVRNGTKKQCCVAAGHIVNNEEGYPHDRRKCHNENPSSTIEHICEENVIARKENVQNSKSQETSVQSKEKKNFPSTSVSCPTIYEDCVEQSVEDASTVIIYPLLSCRYENEVSKIRQKLNNMFENVKDKDRSPLVNHDTGRACCNYNYCPERRVFQCKTKNRKCEWRLDVVKDSVSYTETPSQSGRSSECLGHEDEMCDGESEDRTKVVSKCIPSHSKKQDIMNDSCDQICSLRSQSISSRNKNSKESPEHLVTPQQCGRNKVTHSHCNFDAEHCGFEINRKGRKDVSHPSVKSDEEHTEELKDDDDDDDDDDTFYYRQSMFLSSHDEKEGKRITKRVCLNSQSMSVRNASGNTVSGPSVTYHHPRSMQTVFSNTSSHGAAHTPHDGTSKTKEVLPRTKRMKSVRSGYLESEDYKTGDTGNSTKGNAVTEREIKTETLHNFRGSHCAIYDGGNPKRASVLSRGESSTAASNHIGSEDVRTDGRSSCMFGDSLEKEYITPTHKCGRKSSNYLFGSAHNKNEVVVVDCGNNSGVDDNRDCITDFGKMPNRTNVTTSRKHWSKSLRTSAEAKQVETECNRSSDTSHLIVSDYGKNEHEKTDDGKCPDSENHLTRSKRGVKLHKNSVRSKNSENEEDITDNMRDINKRNVLNRRDRGAATSSYHLIDSEHTTNEDVTDEKVLFNDGGNDSKEENILNRRKRTGTSKHHEINYDDDDDDIIICKIPKYSWFSEKDIADNKCGNRNSTSLKASRSNTHASVPSSHSQMLTRSNITRELSQHPVKPVSFESEGTVNNVSSSDETSSGIEDLLTDSYRRKISRGMMKQFPRRDESVDRSCRMKTERKLMKKRSTETRECLPTGEECLENEKDVAYDIFYTPAKHLLFNEKKKEERLTNIYHTGNITCEKSGKSFNSNSSQNMSSRNNVSRESVECSVEPVVFEAINTEDTVVSCEEMPKEIESYRKQFSGNVKEATGSHNKSDVDIHKMNSMRTKKQWDQSFTSKHPGNEEEVMQHHDDGGGDDADSDDSIFYKTPKHSWFNEKEKTDNSCGNRNSTSVKSNRSHTYAGVPSSHSQMLTASNVTRKPHHNEGTMDNVSVSSSDETSTGIEDLLTDSYRRQICRDVMKQSPSDDKSDNNIHVKVQQQRCRRTGRSLQNVLKMKNR